MRVFGASAGGPLLPQRGTSSANPLSISAGLAAMEHLDHAASQAFEHGYVVRDGIARTTQKGGRRSLSLERPLYFEVIRWPKPRMTIAKPIPRPAHLNS